MTGLCMWCKMSNVDHLRDVLCTSSYTSGPRFKTYRNYKIYMQELINFKDQNLSLDYLTLNIPNSVIQ